MYFIWLLMSDVKDWFVALLIKLAIIVVPLFGLPKINNGVGLAFEKLDKIFRIINLDNK